MNPVRNLLIGTILPDFRPKTRPVMIINPVNSLPHPGTAIHRCIYCKIAAFGMTSYIKIPRNHLSCLLQITYAHTLSGNRLRKSQIQVFLPPHNTLVSSPISHISCAIRKSKDNRRELCLLILRNLVYIIP